MDYTYDGKVQGFVHFKRGKIATMFKALQKKIAQYDVRLDMVRAFEVKEFYKNPSGEYVPLSAAEYDRIAFAATSNDNVSLLTPKFVWNLNARLVAPSAIENTVQVMGGARISYEHFMKYDELRLAMLFTITEEDKKQLGWL